MFEYQQEQKEQENSPQLKDVSPRVIKGNSLLTELEADQNPFSFYNNDKSLSGDDSDGPPIEDVTYSPFQHKTTVQNYTPKSLADDIIIDNQSPSNYCQFSSHFNQGFFQTETLNKTSEGQQDMQSSQPKQSEKLNCCTQNKVETIKSGINLFEIQWSNTQQKVAKEEQTVQQSLPTIHSELSNCLTNQQKSMISMEIIESQNQLDQDMNQLKQSFAQKCKGKKQSVKDSNNNNKTSIPSPNKLPGTVKQLPNVSYQVSTGGQNNVYKLMGSQKKENFKAIREWEQQREENLDMHQRMVQIFLAAVDKRVKSSAENFQIYYQFFKDKAAQQQKYISVSLVNTRSALGNCAIAKTLYGSCSTVLHALSQETSNRCRKIADFVQLIKQNILKDLMDGHLSESQKQLLVIREKISSAKESLQKYTEHSMATSQQLQKCFTEGSTPPKDLYAKEIKLLRRCNREQIVQKKYGLLTLQFYKKAIQQDIKRTSVIREALITYSKGMKETHNFDMERQEMEQLSKGEEARLIEQFYSFQQIFEEIIEDPYLKKWKRSASIPKSQHVSLQHFKNYLQNYKVAPFEGKTAVLRQYNVIYKPKQSKNGQNCTLILTVDAYIHFCIQNPKKQQYTEAEVSFPVIKKGVQLTVLNGENVQVIKKEERRSSVISYFWDSKKNPTYCVKFANSKEKEQFVQIIKGMIK